MSELYVDSSIVVALMLEEDHHRGYAKLLEKSDVRYSSHLLEAEVFATASREKISFQIAEKFIDFISLIIPDRSLKSEYHHLFNAGFCRGADACHIATALYLDPKGEKLVFLSADKDQNKVARTVGFKIPSLP